MSLENLNTIEAKYDTTVIWDIKDIAKRKHFKIEDIKKVSVGKWARLFIELKNGKTIIEDADTDNITDFKWSLHDSFYDADFNVLDEQEHC